MRPQVADESTQVVRELLVRQQGRKRTTPVQFVREVRDEMRQVAWPSRSELINYTSVVLTTLIIMISLIFVLNLAFGKLITLLFTK